MSEAEIIGIDHGWSHIKTVSDVFVTSVREISTEPAFYDGVVEYQGKYYKVGGQRLEVKDNKVENDDFYILTLAAIAIELKRRGRRNATIYLGAGLPINMFGAQKPDFLKYLSRNKDIKFKFENIEYNVKLEHVSVFPQCYAAVFDNINNLKNEVLIVDIGSWTLDMMLIKNHKPDTAACYTVDEGLITCMRTINDKCIQVMGKRVTEANIEEIMVYGNSDIPKEYQNIIKDGIKEYTRKILRILKEYGFDLDTMPVVFCGGGACVIKRYMDGKNKNFTFVEDVKANARGFELLTRQSLKGQVMCNGK